MNKFFAFLYEFFVKNEVLSDKLYEAGTYVVIGGLMLIITLLVVVLYYKIIDPVNWTGPLYWSIVMGINASIQVFVGLFASISVTENYGISTAIGLHNALWSIIPFFLFSVGMRFLSNNNRYNPFWKCRSSNKCQNYFY